MIYLLEDDENIRGFVLYALNNSGLTAKGFERPSEFWAAVKEEIPELVLLDIMLPDEDGLSVLKKIRGSAALCSLPVIMLTAKGTEFDKVTGLDGGADDYISKPFGTMELIARIKALLRRVGSDNKTEYVAGGLYVSPPKRVVKVNGAEVKLTFKEFELLCFLLENIGEVVTRERIIDRIWGGDFGGESRTVDVHIRTLRGKLGECGGIIETVRGVGYKAVKGADI